MAFCNQCGKQLVEGSGFCTNCGKPVKAAGQPAPVPPPPFYQPAPPVYQAPPPVYQAAPPVYQAAPPVYQAAPPENKEESDITAEPLADKKEELKSMEEPPAYRTPNPAYNAPPSYGQFSSDRNTFVNSYLSIVVLGALFITALNFGIFSGSMFLTLQNLLNIFAQLCLFGSIAFATVISTRAKGPDLSIGPVMALSSALIAVVSVSTGSLVLGITISLFVCAAIGIANGAVITYLRAPSVIVTLVTGVIARGILNLLLDGKTITVGNDLAAIAQYRIGGFSLGGLIIFVLTFAAAFLMIILTKLGVPAYKRDKKPALSYMFAYMASALIASIAGLYMTARIMAASPAVGSGYEPFILIVFACVAGSRVLDNRFAPAVYALAPALLYSMLGNMFSIAGYDVFVQIIIQALIAVILIAVAFVARLRPQNPTGTEY